MITSWTAWALLAALFAALTAIFAKVGIEGVDSDYATWLRTLIVVAVLTAIVSSRGVMFSPFDLSGRTLVFLTLSGLATGASWLCYFRALQLGQAAQVAPIDKLSVVIVAIFGVAFLGERLTPTNWAGIAMIATGAWLTTMR